MKRLSVLAVLTATIGAIFSSLPTVSADPIGLSVVGTTDRTVDLEWDKTTLAEVEFGWYLIERHTRDFEMFYMRISDINTTAWTDWDLHPSTEYGYKIYVCYAASIWPSCDTFEESGYVSAITQNTTVYATKEELAIMRSELLNALWSLQQSFSENMTQLRWDVVNTTSDLRSDFAGALYRNISLLRSDVGNKTTDQEERIIDLEIENSQLRDDASIYLMLLIVVLIIAIIAISMGAVGMVRAGRARREVSEWVPPPPEIIEVERVVVPEEVPEEMPPEPVEEVEPPVEEMESVEEEKAEPEEGEGVEKGEEVEETSEPGKEEKAEEE
ncbi:MAG: hypothetical protein ACE5IO_05645 [Thermoplasmata archaeon]